MADDKQLDPKAESNPAEKKDDSSKEAKPQQIRIEIGGGGGKKLNNEFAHNAPQDVNVNVGSFGNVKDPSKDAPKEDELIVADKSKQFENIKGKDVEIDFAKFDKKKVGKKHKQKEYKPGKTKFAVTLDTWLHNRSTCIKVWMVAMAIMIVCMAVGLGLAIPSVINLKNPQDWWLVLKSQAIAGTVFGFIAGLLFVIPLFYLLITVLVGIRGVASSRNFHYFLWVCLIICFVSLIICCGLCGNVFAHADKFTSFAK